MTPDQAQSTVRAKARTLFRATACHSGCGHGVDSSLGTSTACAALRQCRPGCPTDQGGDSKLTIGTTSTIYVAIEPQDGRKGIDRLAGVVRTVLGRDPTSDDRFVFKNRRGDMLKILAWKGDGFTLFLRRLEKGVFAFPTVASQELAITPTQLAMILVDIDLAQTRTRKHFRKNA